MDIYLEIFPFLGVIVMFKRNCQPFLLTSPTVFLFIFFVFLILFFYQPLEIEDGWWHLSTARWMVEHGGVPHQDIFPFEHETKAWSYTQWLGSVIFYFFYKLGGMTGLKAFRAFILALAVILFIFYARRKIRIPVLIVLSLFLAHGLAPRCLLRPLIFNYIFIQIVLMILLSYLKDGTKKILWLLPVMGLVWDNIHLGSFIYGAPLIGLAGGILGAEYFCRTFIKKEKTGRLKTMRSQSLDILKIGLIYLLVFFINPYGIQGGFYPWKVFSFSDSIHFYKFSRIIEEMQSPLVLWGSAQGALFFILFILGLVSVMKIQKNRWPLVAWWLYSVLIFSKGVQGGAFFVVVTLYVVVEWIQEKTLSLKSDLTDSLLRLERVFVVVMMLLIGGKIIGMLPKGILAQGRLVRSISLDFRAPHPVRAVEFLRKNRIAGKVFNDEKFGGFLIWTSYPDLKPFIDGRQVYPERYFEDYLGVMRDPDENWPVLQKKYQFDLILLDKTWALSQRFTQYLNLSQDWKLIFSDEYSLVYVPAGIPVEPLRLNHRRN